MFFGKKNMFPHYWIYIVNLFCHILLVILRQPARTFRTPRYVPFQARAEFLLYLRKSYGNEVRILAMDLVTGYGLLVSAAIDCDCDVLY